MKTCTTYADLAVIVVLIVPVFLRMAVAAEPDPGPISRTFSIVAYDPESGACGAAVASKYPAVGRVVPYVRAGVGAFCTQHWHEPKFGCTSRWLPTAKATTGEA
jgi:hypothetical protein